MKVKLFPFQERALTSLRKNCYLALNGYKTLKTQQVISFTAPTGAGKTVIMSAFIEKIFNGDNILHALPNAIVVWLSDMPNLNQQSRKKIESKADKIHLDQCVTITDELMDMEMLEDGKIYFLNTQKLSKTSLLTRHSDLRQFTIWETLQNTILQKSDRLYFIIDEAHRGAKDSELGTARTIMQKFIKGSKENNLSPMPLVIGMSATSERFNELVKGASAVTYPTIVTPDEVRKSGLLKDMIYVEYPDNQLVHLNMSILQTAALDWKDKCNHWFQYCQEQHYPHVYPIFLIQVENGKGNRISMTDLDDCLKKIQNTTGVDFIEGEVVHTFGDTKDSIQMNGLKVNYIEPSNISDDRNVKIVFFKENLSTGWDCPRAETMMSFKGINEETYIMQLLGRMIRTPMQQRIKVDESLNNVHLFLPLYNRTTVKKILDYWKKTEGGNSLTDIMGHSISGGSEQAEITLSVSFDRPSMNGNSLSESTNEWEACDEDHVTGSSHDNSNEISIPQKSTAYTPCEEDNNNIDPLSKSADNESERHKIVEEINSIGFKTYEIRRAKVANYFTSLFNLSRLLSQSGLYPTATTDIINEIVAEIHTYIQDFKKTGKYDKKTSEILEFKLNTQVLDPYGNEVDKKTSKNLVSTTDSDIDIQFSRAEQLLGNQGIGQTYGRKYFDENSPNSYKMDYIIYTSDSFCIESLYSYAEEKYNSLKDDENYKSKMRKTKGHYLDEFNRILTDADEISEHSFRLPDSISIATESDGSICTDHLYVNKNGEVSFRFDSWEERLLEEERAKPDFVYWLRNQPRKPWALRIPYIYNNENKSMYPDFIIIRKNSEGDYFFDIMEPHNSELKDNLYKAQGLAEYAKKENHFSHIQLIRLKGEKLRRLDFSKTQVRDRVLKCISDEQLDKLFDTDAI